MRKALQVLAVSAGAAALVLSGDRRRVRERHGAGGVHVHWW